MGTGQRAGVLPKQFVPYARAEEKMSAMGNGVVNFFDDQTFIGLLSAGSQETA